MLATLVVGAGLLVQPVDSLISSPDLSLSLHGNCETVIAVRTGSGVMVIGSEETMIVHGLPPDEAAAAALPMVTLAGPQLAPAQQTPLQQCIAAALQACGQGQICSVVAIGGDPPSCSITCRDIDGECPSGEPPVSVPISPGPAQ